MTLANKSIILVFIILFVILVFSFVLKDIMIDAINKMIVRK